MRIRTPPHIKPFSKLLTLVIIIGTLLTEYLGFFRKVIFLLILSIILKFSAFSASFSDCIYAGFLSLLVRRFFV